MQKEIMEVKSLHTSLQDNITNSNTRLIQNNINKEKYIARKQNLEKLMDIVTKKEIYLKEKKDELEFLKKDNLDHKKFEENVEESYQSIITSEKFLKELEFDIHTLELEQRNEMEMKIENDTIMIKNQLNEIKNGAQTKFKHLDEERERELNTLHRKIENKQQEIIVRNKRIELERQKEIEKESKRKADEEIERKNIQREIEAQKEANRLAMEAEDAMKKKQMDERQAREVAEQVKKATKDKYNEQEERRIRQQQSITREEKAIAMREAIMKANAEARSQTVVEASYTSDSDTDSLFKAHDDIYRAPKRPSTAKEMIRVKVQSVT